MIDNLVRFPRMGASTANDSTLIDDCRKGDRGALDELFRRHGDQVRRIVARLRYVPKQDIEDVVQGTFLEVFRSAGRYDGRAAVTTWIVGIAMNVVRHYIRAESRRNSVVSLLRLSNSAAGQVATDDAASNRQLLTRLESAFDRLSERLRIVFTLCDLEEMRGVDVARALNIAEGTVWRRLHDARLQLRSALERQDSR